ncbi:hypothetical protein AB205_0200980 [Aquarana catesbeiana]|uniref:G-protein coupled receptors family 1 profile domain-containing protein n=1 Tax=Aquarana catesbeiana TaxID=8400 RepID=A0A2G9S220_AQUCT|nr:hypothetical protein AB205_0200980 [Aquarana catesbeiana]
MELSAVGFSRQQKRGVLFHFKDSISFVGCMTQFYFHFGAIENFLLAIMAYDRYVAVCIPLRYLLIMSPNVCFKLLWGSWVFGFIVIIMLSL